MVPKNVSKMWQLFWLMKEKVGQNHGSYILEYIKVLQSIAVLYINNYLCPLAIAIFQW